MKQGTSHLVTLTVDNTDLEGKKVIVYLVTLLGNVIRKTVPQIIVAGNEIAIPLSQEETLQLPEGPVRVLVRWVDAGENADVSDMGYLDLYGILDKNVIEYGGDG